jgi:hypothetical protein
MYAVNKVTGKMRLIGKLDESASEKRARDFVDWNKKEGIQQAGRAALQEDAQRHAERMQTSGLSNSKELEAYKAQLNNLKPEVQNKAWSEAYDQVLAKNPALKNMLFTEEKNDKGELTGRLLLKPEPILDKDGNVTNKDKMGNRTDVYNPEVYKQFIDAVNQEAKSKLGLPTFDLKGYNDSREIDPQRQSAVDRLIQWNANNPSDQIEINDETIQNMMEDQNKESRDFGQNKVPTIPSPLPVINPDYQFNVNPQVKGLGFEPINLGQRPELRPKPTGWWRRNQAGASY